MAILKNLNAVRRWQQPSPGWGKGECTAHGVGAHTLKSDGAKRAINETARKMKTEYTGEQREGWREG